MSEPKPTRIQFGNPDGSWTDITKDVQSIEMPLLSDYDPKLKEAWDSLLEGLPEATFTFTASLIPEPEQYTVTGTYVECLSCAAPPVFPLPEGSSISLHRAPNPAGAHLKTEEPIFITVHRADCPLTKSIREER